MLRRDALLTQPQRLAALMVDIAVVAVACQFLFGAPYPPLGDKGFWAYSALLAVLVGSRLVTPFYVKPVDAISYAVPAFVSLMLVNAWDSWSADQRWGFSLVAAFSLLVVVMGLATIVANSLKFEWANQLSNRLRIALDLIGRPEFVYAPVIVFAVLAFHSKSETETATILTVTMITVLAPAGVFLVVATSRLKRTFGGTDPAPTLAGQIAGFQEPGIVLLREEFEGDIKNGDVLYIADRHGPKKLVLALNHVGRSEGVLLRAVTIKELSPAAQSKIGDPPPEEFAYHIAEQTLGEVLAIEGISKDAQQSVVGLVAPDTTIETLYFEVTDNSELEAGRLVSTQVGASKVMYQIVSGITKEEVVQQKNTYGYLRGQAQQIGVWDSALTKFFHCSWLPIINLAVYLEKRANYRAAADSVGHFPGTNFRARIKNINELVTHNTAILGILGIGKSMLAIELVERMIHAGIKVICLDLTEQYARELADFYDEEYEERCLERLRQASEKERKRCAENPQEGGSKPDLAQAIFDDLSDFLGEENPRLLKIYHPAAFAASKQLHEPRNYQKAGQWVREAALWAVTPVEVTHMISEAALEIVSDRMSSTARACLVYEEAHSLIPEWNSVVDEGDRIATSGTARAILQGRKFGLGCLVVTQRTANVTKTILNQCNTVFAMKTFDETGKEFLASYIGRAYSETLSSLPERHAVFFGRASSCENPVLIRLNDRDQFRAAFRAQFPPPQMGRRSPPGPNEGSASAPGRDSELGEDVPF
jgi:hypothetical protein